MAKSTWDACVQGTVPHVVLDRVLYLIDVGTINMAWLDKGNVIHDRTPTKRVGAVPARYNDLLPNTGYRLTKVGPIALPRG